MFERYNNIGFPKIERCSQFQEHSYVIEIIDSDFKEIIDVYGIIPNNFTPTQVLNLFIDPIFNFYKNKNLNVSANFARAFKYMCDRFCRNENHKIYFDNLCKLNKDIAEYKDDIEKYLALI